MVYSQNPYMNKRRAESREWLWEYLSTHPCVDCGEADPIVLEFDHVIGEKIQPVTRLVQWGAAKTAIEAEIAKCEVRCANCHRRVTYKRANSYRTIERGVV